VSERDEDLVPPSPDLADPAERLFELVLAQVELERPDHRDRKHGSARQHLLRVDEGRQVDASHTVAQAERLLPRFDRFRVVLARPALEVQDHHLANKPVDMRPLRRSRG
jgi:hypothetical protein